MHLGFCACAGEHEHVRRSTLGRRSNYGCEQGAKLATEGCSQKASGTQFVQDKVGVMEQSTARGGGTGASSRMQGNWMRGTDSR
eukprot:6209976-Pleurochrysis_carterae.AAC.4